MSIAALDRIIASEQALIVALDGDGADAIQQALGRFADAIEGLRGAGGWRDMPDVVIRVTQALQLAEAARVRTLYLADRTRRQIEELAALNTRSGGGRLAYGRNGMMRP